MRLAVSSFVLLLAGATAGCTQPEIILNYQSMYQSYTAQSCEADHEDVFEDLSKSFGPYQSRSAVDDSLVEFIKSTHLSEIHFGSACFYEAVGTRNVPLYGGAPMMFKTYFELWIIPTGDQDSSRVCVGMNSLLWKTPHKGDQNFPQDAITPQVYRGHPASQSRYLPICVEGGAKAGHLHK